MTACFAERKRLETGVSRSGAVSQSIDVDDGAKNPEEMREFNADKVQKLCAFERFEEAANWWCENKKSKQYSKIQLPPRQTQYIMYPHIYTESIQYYEIISIVIRTF